MKESLTESLRFPRARFRQTAISVITDRVSGLASCTAPPPAIIIMLSRFLLASLVCATSARVMPAPALAKSKYAALSLRGGSMVVSGPPCETHRWIAALTD